MEQSEPGRPDLSKDDLQRSPEQDPDEHRRSAAALQEAVAEVAAMVQGRSENDALRALTQALARRGQPEQPAPWMRAVAAAAVAGETYVVSDQALTDTGLDVPAHDVVEESSGRDRGQDPA